MLNISVSKHEEVVWDADATFKITAITKSKPRPGMEIQDLTPPSPFYGTMPCTAGVAPFQIHSGPARTNSVGQAYKITIDYGGQILDPDIFCMM